MKINCFSASNEYKIRKKESINFRFFIHFLSVENFFNNIKMHILNSF